MYALRCQYREATQGAITAVLRSPTFPARPGTLTDSGKQRFVAAVVKEPAHPKRRFTGEFLLLKNGKNLTSAADSVLMF